MPHAISGMGVLGLLFVTIGSKVLKLLETGQEQMAIVKSFLLIELMEREAIPLRTAGGQRLYSKQGIVRIHAI